MVGALRIYSGEPSEFTEEDVRLLYQFAEHAWTALSNAKAYEGLLKEKESLREDLWDWYEYDAWRH